MPEYVAGAVNTEGDATAGSAGEKKAGHAEEVADRYFSTFE